MRNLGRRLDRIEKNAFPEGQGGMGLALMLVDDAFNPTLSDDEREALHARFERKTVGRYLAKLGAERAGANSVPSEAAP